MNDSLGSNLLKKILFVIFFMCCGQDIQSSEKSVFQDTSDLKLIDACHAKPNNDGSAFFVSDHDKKATICLSYSNQWAYPRNVPLTDSFKFDVSDLCLLLEPSAKKINLPPLQFTAVAIHRLARLSVVTSRNGEVIDKDLPTVKCVGKHIIASSQKNKEKILDLMKPYLNHILAKELEKNITIQKTFIEKTFIEKTFTYIYKTKSYIPAFMIACIWGLFFYELSKQYTV